MIRVYCQISVGGYKIFNILAFPHGTDNGIYIKMDEISHAWKENDQVVLVTSKSACGLSTPVIKMFGSRDIQAVLLNGEKECSTLFLKHEESSFAYAFTSDNAEDTKILRTMACVWITEQSKLLSKLQKMTEKIIEAEELVLMFHKTEWESLCQELSILDKFDFGRFENVHNGKKNLMINSVTGKNKILNSLSIHYPISSFVTIPGNPIVAQIEKRERIIKYAIFGGIAGICIVGGILFCCSEKNFI